MFQTRRKRLKDIFDIADKNIIAYITQVQGYENILDEMSAEEAMTDYLYNRSGDKWASPLVHNILRESGDAIAPAQLQALAALIYRKYSRKWKSLLDTYQVDYDPISNYDMTESEHIARSGTESGTRTDTTEHGHVIENTSTGSTDTDSKTTYGSDISTTKSASQSGTDSTEEVRNLSRTETGTDTTVTTFEHGENITETSEASAIQKSSIFAFNSTEQPVPTDSADGSNSTEQTTTHSGKDSENKTYTRDMTFKDSGTDTTTRTLDLRDSGTSSESHTGDDTVSTLTSTDSSGKVTNSGTDTIQSEDSREDSSDEVRTLTRSGNIGVTTTQQMIEQERQLWRDSYFDTLYSDLDEMLTLGVY